MRILFGFLIQVSGWALLAWALVAGLGFCAIFLVNFIGTKGAEGGQDVLMAAAATLLVTLIGLGVVKLGTLLGKSGREQDQGQADKQAKDTA